MDDFDIGAEHLVFRADAVGKGMSDAALRRDVRTGAKERVWHGAYLPTSPPTSDEPGDSYPAELERYRATVVAASLNGGPKRTASHVSAAAMHRIPLLRPDLTTVHFTSVTTGKTIKRGVVHQAALRDSDIEIVGDIPVTSRARSICDVARTGTFAQGVCVLDSGLHLGVPMYEIAEQVEHLRRHHGIAMLRSALASANGLSESIGETVSRLVLGDNPLIPSPDLQVAIPLDVDGTRMTARGDFGWRDVDGVLRVVGEFDGRIKYHRSNPFGDRLPEEVIYEEKVREDAIRATGPLVVRWTWSDSMRPKVLHTKVIAALRAANLLR
ncbi:hypothetical protein [Gordonia insulae]|uniref:AbiEi antitoxin C-terminal domain-containing protein n=1 Tax=Gordonia insulae TaxID=2420509 RepID=A0A3G8JTP4_9ACTN|nr:hypothetical protein [Gordonia insulae]AZG48236.1 hypothetical protein D7316_04853 [Gordonia insulae]